MIRNVSIVSRFARFLRNPQISPILPHHHSGEITLLNALFLTTQTRTPPPTRQPRRREKEVERENKPLFYNRLLRKRTAVGWCENPPHAPVRRVRRIGRSAFPCGSPTIARHRCVTRLKSTAVSNGTRGLSRGSISFRILSTFFFMRVCKALCVYSPKRSARNSHRSCCPLKRKKERKKEAKEKLFNIRVGHPKT